MWIAARRDATTAAAKRTAQLHVVVRPFVCFLREHGSSLSSREDGDAQLGQQVQPLGIEYITLYRLARLRQIMIALLRVLRYIWLSNMQTVGMGAFEWSLRTLSKPWTSQDHDLVKNYVGRGTNVATPSTPDYNILQHLHVSHGEVLSLASCRMGLYSNSKTLWPKWVLVNFFPGSLGGPLLQYTPHQAQTQCFVRQ